MSKKAMYVARPKGGRSNFLLAHDHLGNPVGFYALTSFKAARSWDADDIIYKLVPVPARKRKKKARK